MKILFITLNDITDSFGGAIATRRNYDMLTTLFGKKNVDVILFQELPNTTLFEKIKKTITKFFTCRYININPLKTINVADYDIVFNDSSFLGLILKYLRYQGYKGKIITFFQDCGYTFFSSVYAHLPFYIREPMRRVIVKNESAALIYSDLNVVLNDQDLKDLQRCYLCNFPYMVVPICIQDVYDQSCEVDNNYPKPLFTFVGSFFGPNISGIIWFIKNVLPYVDIYLRVIGRGMDKIQQLSEFPKCVDMSKLEIISTVPDLGQYIYESDCMVCPIFDGSGMKVKTCEALMYAKNIIGTKESFMGYGIDDYSKVGGVCYTADDFIQAIRLFKLPRHNQYSRELYLSSFSYESSLKKFKQMMECLGVII